MHTARLLQDCCFECQWIPNSVFFLFSNFTICNFSR